MPHTLLQHLPIPNISTDLEDPPPFPFLTLLKCSPSPLEVITRALPTVFVFSRNPIKRADTLRHSTLVKSLEQREPSDSRTDGGGWREAADPAPAKVTQMMFSGGLKKRARVEASGAGVSV